MENEVILRSQAQVHMPAHSLPGQTHTAIRWQLHSMKSKEGDTNQMSSSCVLTYVTMLTEALTINAYITCVSLHIKKDAAAGQMMSKLDDGVSSHLDNDYHHSLLLVFLIQKAGPESVAYL